MCLAWQVCLSELSGCKVDPGRLGQCSFGLGFRRFLSERCRRPGAFAPLLAMCFSLKVVFHRLERWKTMSLRQ